MATYLDRPNAQSYQFRPYELPVAQIAQAISSRSLAWEVSADGVRDAYEKAAGLSLSRRESKEKLQDFMTKADDLMRKASRTDLSIGDNQKRAVNIFKPLYQDQTIMLDHANTTFYQQEFQKAENFKTRDGGKEFNQTNMDYMNEKYNDFVNDPNYDTQTLQKHYNERRGYTPYYNYSTEFENITKLCKPNSAASQGMAVDSKGNPTLYFDVRSDKALSSAKLAGCLTSSLSDKAKHQMQIEGYMSYGKNYQGLATDYIGYSDRELDTYRKQRGAIDGRIQGLRDKKSLTEEEKLELAQLGESSSQITDYINDQSKTRNLVASGNLDYVRQNYEKLAGPLYMNQKIGQYSNFYQYEEVSRKLEENNAAMLQYKTQVEVDNIATRFKQQQSLNAQDFVYDVRLQQMRQAGALELQELKSMTDMGVAGMRMQRIQNPDGTFRMVPVYPDANPAATEANLKQNSQQLVYDQYHKAIAQKTDADEFLYDSFKHRWPQYTDSKSLIASTEFQNFMKTNPDNRDINAWIKSAHDADRQIVNIEALRNDIEENLRTNNPELLNSTNVKSTQALRMPNGEVVNAQKIAAGILGTDPDLRFVRVPSTTDVDVNNPFSNVLSDDIVMQYKGQNIRLEGTQARKIYSDIKGQLGERVGKLEEKRSQLYSDKYFELSGMKDIGNDNSNPKNPLRNRLSATLGVDPDQVILRKSNLTGDVWVDFQDTEKKPLPKDVLAKLRTNFKVDSEGKSFKLSNVPEYTFFQSNNYYKDELTYINSFIKVNKDKLGRREPVEVPIKTETDTRTGAAVPSYKLVVKRGPGQTMLYQLHKKNADGVFVATQQEIASELEALKYIQEFDKYNTAK